MLFYAQRRVVPTLSGHETRVEVSSKNRQLFSISSEIGDFKPNLYKNVKYWQ